MAKRSGGKKGPKAKDLREVGQKAKVATERPAMEPGEWVEIMVGTARTLKPAWVLDVSGLRERTLVQVVWPNSWAHDPEDDRAAWTGAQWLQFKQQVHTVGLRAMEDRSLVHLGKVLEVCGFKDQGIPQEKAVEVWQELTRRGLRKDEDEKDGPEEPDAGEDDQDGGEAEPAQGDRTVGGKILEGAVEALEAKAEKAEGTKPSGTVHVEIDRPIGRLVGEHADLQGVRLLHDPKTEEAWALASNGAVMAAMPVMMTLPEIGAAPWEADVVPGEAAMGKPGKPRALELRAGRPQGLFDTGVAWVSSLENRWWGTWKPTRACWMADALPNVPANGQGVVPVRLRAEQMADLAKVVGDEQGGVTLLLDVAELGKAQPGVEGEKAKVRVGVVGENETGVGAPVGVLMMEVQGSGACKRYLESHGRLLRLTAAPRNQLTGKMD
ncbi:MAG: hypothetical protein IOD15_14720 [Phycisphaerales bacterium]|nr:hypothetical protein [Phycisphaerales bacterium]